MNRHTRVVNYLDRLAKRRKLTRAQESIREYHRLMEASAEVGGKVRLDEDEDESTCARCGSEDETGKYCSECGERMRTVEDERRRSRADEDEGRRAGVDDEPERIDVGYRGHSEKPRSERVGAGEAIRTFSSQYARARESGVPKFSYPTGS